MSVPEVSLTATLRITGLPQAITPDLLVEHFSNYGVVSNPIVTKDPNQIEAPHALLRFNDLCCAREAVREENHVILGHKVNVERVGPEPVVLQQWRKIFVGGVAANVTEEDVRDFFRQFGEIEDCFIPRDPHTGKPRHLAFVVFRDMKPVKDVLDGKESKFYELKGNPVEVKAAKSRESMEAKKAKSRESMGNGR